MATLYLVRLNTRHNLGEDIFADEAKILGLFRSEKNARECRDGFNSKLGFMDSRAFIEEIDSDLFEETSK
jgi:hypothetical protein